MIQKKTKLMTMKKIIKRKYERKGSNSDDNDKENNKTKKNRKTSENHIKKSECLIIMNNCYKMFCNLPWYSNACLYSNIIFWRIRVKARILQHGWRNVWVFPWYQSMWTFISFSILEWFSLIGQTTFFGFKIKFRLESLLMSHHRVVGQVKVVSVSNHISNKHVTIDHHSLLSSNAFNA